MTHPFTLGLLLVVLTAAAVTDVRRGLIYNWLTYPAMGVGVLAAALVGWWSQGANAAGHAALASLMGLMVGFVAFALIAVAGLGGGDVKLMAAAGAILADLHLLLAISFYAFAFALLLSLIVMIRKGIVRRTMQSVFVAGMMATSRVAPQFPKDSPRIPFGLAVCLGGYLMAGELLTGWHMPWSPLM